MMKNLFLCAREKWIMIQTIKACNNNNNNNNTIFTVDAYWSKKHYLIAWTILKGIWLPNFRSRNILLGLIVLSTYIIRYITNGRYKVKSKSEYILLDHVLKKNFLLQEQISSTAEELLKSHILIGTYKLNFEELQLEKKKVEDELLSTIEVYYMHEK